MNKVMPMGADERVHLLFIYNTRLRYWLTSFIGLACLVYGSLYGIRIKEKHLGMTEDQLRLACLSLFEVPIIFVAVFTYLKRIAPFKKDVQKGEKEAIGYQIVRKQYFEHTQQYFVSFDNPNYMHHQVDEAFFHNCSPSDYAYMYRAPLSKYVFDKGGRFSIL